MTNWNDLLVSVIFVLFLMGAYMIPPTNAQTSQGLPHESASSSELLKATHLFTVYVNSLTAEPWSVGKDGLEHRSLFINAKLVDLYKGTLSILASESFSIQVIQSRETGFVVSDYHGLWSHINPRQGDRYLVVAEGDTQDPALLMIEPSCRSLVSADRAFDVRLALETEKRIRANPIAADDEEGQVTMLSKLLDYVVNEGSGAQRLFAGYLWARVQPIFKTFHHRAAPRIFGFLEVSTLDIRFRGEFIDSLYKEVLDLNTPPDLRRLLLSSIFRIMLQPEAISLRSSLIDVYAFNLIFRPGEETTPPSRLLDSRTSVDQVVKIVAEFNSERGKQIALWLRQR